MARINANMREAIVQAAVQKSEVSKLREAYGTTLKKWIDDVHLLSVGGKKVLTDLEKAVSAMKDLRDKFPEKLRNGYGPFKRGYSIRVNLAGMNITAYFNGHLSYVAGEEYRYCPSEVVIAGDHPLHDRFLKLEQAKTDFESKECEIRTSVRAAVTSFATVEKLLDFWPEAAELLPAEVPVTSKELAILPETLNGLVGLPTPKKRRIKK